METYIKDIYHYHYENGSSNILTKIKNCMKKMGFIFGDKGPTLHQLRIFVMKVSGHHYNCLIPSDERNIRSGFIANKNNSEFGDIFKQFSVMSIMIAISMCNHYKYFKKGFVRIK